MAYYNANMTPPVPPVPPTPSTGFVALPISVGTVVPAEWRIGKSYKVLGNYVSQQTITPRSGHVRKDVNGSYGFSTFASIQSGVTTNVYLDTADWTIKNGSTQGSLGISCKYGFTETDETEWNSYGNINVATALNPTELWLIIQL